MHVSLKFSRQDNNYIMISYYINVFDIHQQNTMHIEIKIIKQLSSTDRKNVNKLFTLY